MASKSGQQEPEKAEVIQEMLDALDTVLDRVKVLYEQYFLGIQKQPPAYLHTDIERKIRELAQIQIRNTALRYRFATLQQKFGSYNSYWRRTLRQIENGTYSRNLFKIGRQAARTGVAVPEEILAAMPKRMRDQVIRDREAALALAALRDRQRKGDEAPILADGDVDIDVGGLGDDERAAFISEPTDVRRSALIAGGAHRLEESDAEFDVDAFFASVIHEDDAPSPRHEARPPVGSRTRAGHPRPGSVSGAPLHAVSSAAPVSSPAVPGRPTGGDAAVEPPASPRRTTAQMRAVTARTKSDPGAAADAAEAARARTAGQMRATTVRTRTDPGAPADASGAAAEAGPRRTTGQMRAATARTKTDPGTSSPVGEAAPARTGQAHAMTARAKTDPGTSSPAGEAASARTTGQVRAVTARAQTDPGASSAAGEAASARTIGQVRAVTARAQTDPGTSSSAGEAASVRTTGQMRTVTARTKSDPGTSGSAREAGPRRTTGQMRAATARAQTDPGTSSAGGAASARTTGQVRTVTARAQTDPGAPAGAVTEAGPWRTTAPPATAAIAPSQATRPLRVAPGSAAAHAPAPVETLAGPFPRTPNPPPLSGARATPAAGVPRAAQSAVPPVAPGPARPAIELAAPEPAETPAPHARPAAPPPLPPFARPRAAAPRSSSERGAPESRPAPPPGTSDAAPRPPSERGAPESRQAPPPGTSDAAPRPPSERGAPEPRQAPPPGPVPPGPVPPGMSDADVNALYAKYVRAKQILGEEAEPGSYSKLLKTIRAQAPKIMEQYKARGVDFSVVVKDNRVIIRAKPKL